MCVLKGTILVKNGQLEKVARKGLFFTFFFFFFFFFTRHCYFRFTEAVHFDRLEAAFLIIIDKFLNSGRASFHSYVLTGPSLQLPAYWQDEESFSFEDPRRSKRERKSPDTSFSIQLEATEFSLSFIFCNVHSRGREVSTTFLMPVSMMILKNFKFLSACPKQLSPTVTHSLFSIPGTIQSAGHLNPHPSPMMLLLSESDHNSIHFEKPPSCSTRQDTSKNLTHL